MIRDESDDDDGCGAVDKWRIENRWWMDGVDLVRYCKRDMGKIARNVAEVWTETTTL